MQLWLKVVLTLALPVVWGIGSAWLMDSLSRWRRNRRGDAKQDPKR
ncbi:MAG: hypothetical protein LLG44_00440 [Chloroflexi bacterium]|nr:hypothetical protein [Chloroflexota bacterium]